MIGFPKMTEQKSVALKLKLLNAAFIKDETTTPEILAQKIEEVSAPESPQNEVVKFIRDEMRYNESHEQRYAKEWVEYFGKFGTQHLTPRI